MRRSVIVGGAVFAVSGWLIGCDGGKSVTPPTTQCRTANAQNVTLAVGAYQALPPVAGAGCLTFPGNASATDSAIYLLVAQLATDSEGAQTPFLLDGDTLHAVAAAATVSGRASSIAPDLGVRFHDFLRREERTRWADLPAAPQTVGDTAVPSRAPRPNVGDPRTFSVCANLTCSSFQSVNATAKTVNGHLALFVDNNAPANGLAQADYDSLGALFDTRLYALDTTAFGRESDINGDSVVVVLMTNVVNKLVTKTQCAQSGFVGGFFFGADIDPAFAGDPRFNHSEVFYSIVADPDSTLSCSHSVSQVTRIIPVTFVHEFQHMISYNQHVLKRGGNAQVAWLDEGLSHFAEELGGRSFLPGDNATFTSYVIGDLFNGYNYLDSTDTHFLAYGSGIGSLAERGAAWLFVRYLADQFATDTTFAAVAAFTRKLEETSLVGGASVTSATGLSFDTVVERWALALFVSDLPGFAAPPELRYRSWSFRSTYSSLSSQRPTIFPKPFPLTPPATLATAVHLVGTLHAGSGNYARASQPPSAPGFTLLFSGPNGAALPSALVPRLNVIRIR